ARGRRLAEQALAMYRQLYPAARFPDGHTRLADALQVVGHGRHLAGAYAEAVPYLEESLAIRRRLTARQLASASEAEALDYVHAESLARDGYLSVLANLPATADKAYAAVWQAKALVTRVVEARQARARAAGTAQAGRLDRLRALRGRTEQLLQETR